MDVCFLFVLCWIWFEKKTPILHLFLVLLVENVCEPTLSAGVSIKMARHKCPSSAFVAFPSQSGNFPVFIDLVIFEDGELHLLFSMSDLLWLRVHLLLLFFASSSESKDEMKGRFLLDIIVGEGSTILQLLSRKDQTLLIGRNSLFVLDLGLDILDGVRALDLEGDGFSGEGLDEDLHFVGRREGERGGKGGREGGGQKGSRARFLNQVLKQ